MRVRGGAPSIFIESLILIVLSFFGLAEWVTTTGLDLCCCADQSAPGCFFRGKRLPGELLSYLVFSEGSGLSPTRNWRPRAMNNRTPDETALVNEFKTAVAAGDGGQLAQVAQALDLRIFDLGMFPDDLFVAVLALLATRRLCVLPHLAADGRPCFGRVGQMQHGHASGAGWLATLVERIVEALDSWGGGRSGRGAAMSFAQLSRRWRYQ
jgi:hypothetical protein